MKRLLTLFLTAAMLAPLVPQAGAADVLSLSGALPEGAAVHGGVTFEGDAVVFDGSESYIELPGSLCSETRDFTIALNIRFDYIEKDVWQRVLDFGGNSYIGMWQYNGSNNLRVSIGGRAITYFGAFTLGEWTHVALTHTDEETVLYVDAKPVGSFTGEASFSTDAGNYIGKWNVNSEPTDYFHGAIKDFLFIDTAMGFEDVAAAAFSQMSDAEIADSLIAMVYLEQNEGEPYFSYFEFDDGVHSVTWSSADPDTLTVDALKAVSAPEPIEVTLTATARAGGQTRTKSYTFVVQEGEYGVSVVSDTLEKMEIRAMRRSTAQKIDTKKTYLIKKAGEEKYITYSDGALALTGDRGDANALWRFADSAKENIYPIFNKKNGLCMNVYQWSMDKGTQVILYGGGKGRNELWYLLENSGGFSILSYYSELFLTENMTLEGLGQKTVWEIVETADTLVQKGVVTEETEQGAVMDESKHYSVTSGGRSISDTDTLWYMTHIDSGFYTITGEQSALNLNIAGASLEVGAPVITYAAGRDDNEQWIFEELSGGYAIRGKTNKNYIALKDGALVMAAEPFVWEIEERGSKAVSAQTRLTKTLITDYVPAIRSETDDAGFIHPGIAVTKESIERMQKRVRALDEPWTSSFETLASRASASKTPRIHAADGDGDTTALVDERRLKNLRSDASAAADQALMYVVTGDETYRTNAMYIIRKWYLLRDVLATLGSDRIDHGVIAFKLSFAAELMKYSSAKTPSLLWSEEDNEMFVGMLETIEPKHDSYWYWMNQHGLCNEGTMASAIFRGDFECYAYAVKRTTVNPEGGGSIDTTRGSGGAITQVFRYVDFDAHNGDTIPSVFVHAEMGRDQGHAYGNVCALAECAVMMHLQGTKVNAQTGEIDQDGVSVFAFANDRLLEGANYIYKYNLGYDVEHPSIDVGSDIYADINDLNRGNLYHVGGIVYYYYKYYAKADMDAENTRYLAQAYSLIFPENGIPDNIGVSDLLYAPDEAKIDEMPRADARSISTASRLEVENYTSLNYGNAAVKESGDCRYLRITPQDGGTRFGFTSGHYPPGEITGVTLRVRTNSTVTAVLQNEHTVYAPYVNGIIPNTRGVWRTIRFDLQPEGVLRSRMYFFTFDAIGAFDIDFVQFEH